MDALAKEPASQKTEAMMLYAIELFVENRWVRDFDAIPAAQNRLPKSEAQDALDELRCHPEYAMAQLRIEPCSTQT